jgi:hypothetical protein
MTSVPVPPLLPSPPPQPVTEADLLRVAGEEFRLRMARWEHEPPVGRRGNGNRARERWNPPQRGMRIDVAQAYAAHFRHHTAAALLRQAWLQGMYLGHGITSWSEAYHAVLALAIQRGALHLADEHFRDLGEAIAMELCEFSALHDRCANGCQVAYPGDPS